MFPHFMLMVMALLAAAPSLALDCGGETAPCRLANGEYHMAAPEDWRGGPAVIYLHGYGGNGAKVIRNEDFVRRFTQRGYALIAPTGLPWREGEPTDWSVRDGATYPRDDIEFLGDVLKDATARAGVDPDRVLLSGFSRGGSMVWEVACLHPGFARAYAPVSGGFWLPMTQDCVGPVQMLHTHGFADTVVPLEGRAIPNSEIGIVQGDIWEGLQLWRRENASPSNAAEHEIADGLWRKKWDCELGGLELILHRGGHGRPGGWTRITLDWFESLDR